MLFFNSKTTPNPLLVKEGACLAEGECLKTFSLLAEPQLSKPKLDIPKPGLGNEEGFEKD